MPTGKEPLHENLIYQCKMYSLQPLHSFFSKALLDAGFLPDDIYYDVPEEMPENAHRQIIHNGESHDVEGDEPEKMTYTQQANKRQHCQRLTSFIRLCDYLITTTMHALAMNSVTKLLERFDKMIQGKNSL